MVYLKASILFSQLHSDSFTHLRIIWHISVILCLSEEIWFRVQYNGPMVRGFGKRESTAQTAQDPLVSSQSSPEDLQAYASKPGSWADGPATFLLQLPIARSQWHMLSILSIRWVSSRNSDILGTWRESRHVATMILAHRLDSLRLVRGKEGLYQCHQAGHRFNRFDIYRDSVELFPSV